ncbi:hypothetical protein TNCT_563211 [Trichonephila clavata]|uniref:EGF-like domain-containing protein n=1 Tax=Trichonephila clavata TaxID=2740835 RepID=A0A8X6LY20_TRICU|nr:hypothetical protein TNCT_563211 [Trichonephila clavata]
MSSRKLTVFLRICVLFSFILPITRSSLLDKLRTFHSRSVYHTKIEETTTFKKTHEADELQGNECGCKNGKCVSQSNRQMCICDSEFYQLDSFTCEEERALKRKVLITGVLFFIFLFLTLMVYYFLFRKSFERNGRYLIHIYG